MKHAGLQILVARTRHRGRVQALVEWMERKVQVMDEVKEEIGEKTEIR